MTTASTQRERGRQLKHDALEAVAAVQDSGEYGGLAPNWMLPPSIPTQRLSGLKRSGYLGSAYGRWWLTETGCDLLTAMRTEVSDGSG